MIKLRLKANNGRRVAFTLAEGGRSPLFNATKNTKAAFTLAEVLITIGIIGVVAALTLPMFMENVNERVKAKRIENIKQKLSKVTDKMASFDKLQGYQSTGDFVDEMGKHMNITKICKTHVEECWPTSEVTIRQHAPSDKSNTYTISNLKNHDDLRLYNILNDWAEPVGIITADGTSMIISYNKKCSISYDTGLVFDQASFTSNSLNCIAGIFDWNGKSKPNKLGDDVQSLGVAGIKGSCSHEIKTNEGFSICVIGSAHTPTPLTYEQCEANKGDLGINACCDRDTNNCPTGDYWAGAVAECGHKNNMFTPNELAVIAGYVYGVPSSEVKNATANNSYSVVINSAANKRALELGLPDLNHTLMVWSSQENTYRSVEMWVFNSNETTNHCGNGRSTSNRLVLCKGD